MSHDDNRPKDDGSGPDAPKRTEATDVPPRRSLEGRFFGTAFNPPREWLREKERRMRAAHAARVEAEASAKQEENEDA